MIEFREAVQKKEYRKDQTFREMVNASIRECFESDDCNGIYGYMFGRPYVRTASYIRSEESELHAQACRQDFANKGRGLMSARVGDMYVIDEYIDGICIPETYLPIVFKVKGDTIEHVGYLDSSSEFIDRERNKPYMPHEIGSWHYESIPKTGWSLKKEKQ